MITLRRVGRFERHLNVTKFGA